MFKAIVSTIQLLRIRIHSQDTLTVPVHTVAVNISHSYKTREIRITCDTKNIQRSTQKIKRVLLECLPNNKECISI